MSWPKWLLLGGQHSGRTTTSFTSLLRLLLSPLTELLLNSGKSFHLCEDSLVLRHLCIENVLICIVLSLLLFIEGPDCDEEDVEDEGSTFAFFPLLSQH